MLHRVPPDIRIFTPGLRFFSSRRVRRPRSAAWMAAISPAAPAPITATSQVASAIAPVAPRQDRRPATPPGDSIGETSVGREGRRESKDNAHFAWGVAELA